MRNGQYRGTAENTTSSRLAAQIYYKGHKHYKGRKLAAPRMANYIDTPPGACYAKFDLFNGR